MIETGIEHLDRSLGGGIPNGNTLLYYIQPGIEGEIFGIQTLFHNLEKGYKGVFITSSAHPSAIKEYFLGFGWDVDKYEGKFAMVDAYSALVGADSTERYVVEDPENIENINETISEAMLHFPGEVIVCGSLSTIMDLCGEIETLRCIENWNKIICVNDSVGIYNFTAWPYSQETIKKIRDEYFNATIKVGGIAERVIFGQYYGVPKVDWTDTIIESVLFRIYRPGGVRVYLPKILVTGPFNAGKSSFIRSLSSRSVSVDRFGTTVALDHGHVDHKGFSAEIFGTPGQERFDPILKTLGGEAMGVFLVIDSTNPSEFSRAKRMLDITKTFGLPSVIVANKQDMPGASSIESIRTQMKLPEDIPIAPTVSKEGEGVKEAFEMLIDRIMGGL
ncbi:MAG: ATPase domain-containing protein [Halobacteriota archaeon]|nr:ATPase domain-containing protein [Halobacteriota archaeon]